VPGEESPGKCASQQDQADDDDKNGFQEFIHKHLLKEKVRLTE
jgi:hypothetical protein